MVRWMLGILMLGVVVGQSAIIVWQRSTQSSETGRRLEGIKLRAEDTKLRAEGDATLRSMQQRIAELEQTLADGTAGRQAAERDGTHRQAELRDERDGLSMRLQRAEQELTDARTERKRGAAALALAEMELAEQREAAGKTEQELTSVRAELLWQKVRGPSAGGSASGEAEQARGQKPPQNQLPKQPQKQAPQVVTAHSAIAAEMPTARVVPAEPASQSDGAVRSGAEANAGAVNAAAVAAPPKKVVRREARRIRKDATAAEPGFSFLP